MLNIQTTEAPRWTTEKTWAQIGLDQFLSGKPLRVPAGMSSLQIKWVLYGWDAGKAGVTEL